MINAIKILILATTLIHLVGSASGATTKGDEPYNSMVVDRVIDGDTFVAKGLKIRLFGIDAPEKDESGFLASRMYLEVLLDPKHRIDCKYLYTDKYGRFVMMCDSDGHDVGSDMVYFGMAKDFKKYSHGYYADEEKSAFENKRGIWKK